MNKKHAADTCLRASRLVGPRARLGQATAAAHFKIAGAHTDHHP